MLAVPVSVWVVVGSAATARAQEGEPDLRPPGTPIPPGMEGEVPEEMLRYGLPRRRVVRPPSGEEREEGQRRRPAGRRRRRRERPEGAPKGGDYEIYGDLAPDTPRFAVVGAKKPRYHVVRPGDTLWDIATMYFRDPWYWPKLWAMNPSITNPHWIYPGDRIQLSKKRAAPEKKGAPRPAPRKGPKAFGVMETKLHDKTGTITLRQTGFVEEKKVKRAGVIEGSFEEKILLATYDVIYIKMKKKHPLEVGKRYTIYEPVKAVYYPGKKRKIGRMVKICADVEIKSIKWGGPYKKKGVARGVILRAINPVERGYLVGDMKRRYKAVEPIENTNPKLRDLSGHVVAVLDDREVIGTRQLVFLDKGKADGVKVGHVFYVVVRGDGYRRIMERRRTAKPSEAHYPKERIASMVVVDVGPNHSAAVIRSAIRSAQIGNRVIIQYSGPKKRPEKQSRQAGDKPQKP